MTQPKYRIIVLSAEHEDTLTWVTDGWFMEGPQRSDPKRVALFKKARAAICQGRDHHEAIKLLVEAGFEVDWSNTERYTRRNHSH